MQRYRYFGINSDGTSFTLDSGRQPQPTATPALRRDKHDEVYEVAGQEFALPSDVVAELKGAAPLLLEQADAELLAALRAAAGAFARVRELEAGITDALDHLGSAREEDSLDRREQYRVDDCIRSGHTSHTQSCRFPSAARTGRAAPVWNRSERGRGRLRRAR